VFVGSETGLLKGIQIAERNWQNLNSVESSNRSREITSLCWADNEKTQFCAGLRDNCVITFDSSGSSATEDGPFFGASGHIRSIAKYNDRFLTGFSEGIVAVWTCGEDEDGAVKFSAGDNLWAMTQNMSTPNIIATGGKEVPLKLWDLNKPGEAVFAAKNVKNDWLNLRVPVWVTKIQFLSDGRRVVTGTGHNQIRVYDSKVQKRPVIDFDFLKHPLTGLSVCPQRDDQVMVANTFGDLGLVDLRKKKTVQLYKGFSGGITDIACHASAPVVVSCSIDRHVRVHDINTKALVDNFYVKSRLNCLLLSDDWPEREEDKKDRMGKKEIKAGLRAQADNAADDDALWDSMEVVKTKTTAAIEKTAALKRKAETESSSSASELQTKAKKNKKKKSKV
jgi:ribosome biogenesis protein NSA1